MRRFLAWLWKEWRDHRAILVGIGVALPALTALAFLTFPERLVRGVSTQNHVMESVARQDVCEVFCAVALALAVLALASDLFGGDVQRGTLDLVRRTPRGLGCVFTAKLVFLTTALLAAAALEFVCVSACLAVADWADGVSPAALAVSDSIRLSLVVALLFGLWIAFVSIWIHRGAAAIGVFALLLGLILLPAFLVLRDHPFVEAILDDALAPCLLVGAGLLAILASAAGFLRGLRLRRATWSAAWRGLTVVAVVVSGGYAYGAVWLHGILDFRPGESRVWLREAHLGEREDLLFLTAWRGARPDSGEASSKSIHRAFVLDMRTGGVRPTGGASMSWVALPTGAQIIGAGDGGFHCLEPAPFLVEHEVRGGKVRRSWLDGRTGEVLRADSSDLESPETIGWTRASARTHTRVRDAEGRRSWIRPVQGRGVIERDGALAPARPPEEALLDGGLFSVPGGWFGYRANGDLRFVDATTGAEHRLALPRATTAYGVQPLSPERWMRRVKRTKKDRDWSWVVGEVATGQERPARDVPEHVGPVVDRDLVLAVRGTGSGARFVLWNPVSGADVALVGEGELPATDVWTVACWGRRADLGLQLLTVYRQGPESGDHQLAILDPAAGSLRTLAGSVRMHLEPAALTRDGALIAIEDYSRVVRLSHGGREVLFPR